MKYIDARTQNSLKLGVMKFLNLSISEIRQIFISIYENTEKEPWKWVRDFLSDCNVDETLQYIQMFHLSRRLDGTDLKANNNLKQLLLEILIYIIRENYNLLITNLDMMEGIFII